MTRVPNRKTAHIGVPVICAMMLLLSQDGGQALAQGHSEPTLPEALMRTLPAGDDAHDEAQRERDGVCVKIVVMLCREPETEVAAALIRSGPQTRDESEPGKPSIVGFVRNSWPLAVDFEPEPGTFTVLRVKLFHQRFLYPYYEIAYQQVLDPDGSGGRQTIVVDRLQLGGDPGAGNGVRVARVDVRSFRLVNGRLVREHGRAVRAPVMVYGVGVGPDAVGSTAIENARFRSPGEMRSAYAHAGNGLRGANFGAARAPVALIGFNAWDPVFDSMTLQSVRFEDSRPVRIPTGNASVPLTYSYRLDRNYDAVAADLRYCPQNCRLNRRLAVPARGDRTPRAAGQWSVTRRFDPGDYRVQVLAWGQCAGPPTPAALAQCAHSTAWAAGTSGTVRLFR